MDKKDIYEHLANIYLDASLKRKKQGREYISFKSVVFLSAAFVFGLTALSILNSRKDKPANSEVALLLQTEAIKINFNFDPVKKEIYSINLNKLDLNRFRAVGFSVKKANFQDRISLRVEFANAFREKSEIYVKNIPHRWQEYRILFSNFKNLTDWSEMSKLSFAVEEWNSQEKRGVVYIDNVRFLR